MRRTNRCRRDPAEIDSSDGAGLSRAVRPLPIDPLLPRVVDELRRGPRLVLRAAPGAGKTTRVPAALLDGGVAGDRAVVVLEPRRLAARAAAEFVAEERGGAVGGEVGYRVRFESRGGPATRLWFETEGVFARRLAADPWLEDVSVVVLDEFHERHVAGDVALGVVRELQDSVRPDLRLVVMSATLETAAVASFLADCPVLTSEGRSFPVEIEYFGEEPRVRPAARVAAAIARALVLDPKGDVLVFLPGAGAIRRVADEIVALADERGADVVPLHGDLPLEAQRRAILPGPRRRIVLSTNVAETSLTIEGVTAVVDSGLARESRLDPRHGLNRLEEVRISRASAEQRAGRAGRTRPGQCLRLWSPADHEGRRERETPEVLRVDLAATVLELRAWGVGDLRAFPWLDPPDEGALERAERLLRALDALAPDGRPTELGRRMLALPVEPRLARMLLEAARRGAAAGGARIAALASERDVLLESRALADRRAIAPWPAGPSDLLLRMELFDEAARSRFDRGVCQRLGLDAGALRAVERARRLLARAIGAGKDGGEMDPEALLRCVLAGFPDRVVRRRAPGSPRGIMVGGSGIVLDPASVVRDEELFVAVDLDAGARRERSEARVRIASAVRREWLEEDRPDAIREQRSAFLDPESGRVLARTRELYEDLVLRETVTAEIDREAASRLLAEALRRDPSPLLADEALAGLLERLRFLGGAMPEAGLPVPETLLEKTVAAAVAGRRSIAEVVAADPGAIALGLLDPAARRFLEREAPVSIRLPPGRSVRVRYEAGRTPGFAARIQDLFGLAASPRVAGGRVALRIEILAPNQRPVQVTDDLGSFWARTYPEVRKQLRGRYPKHAWPEAPGAARRS